jgi:hypothetical protein
MAEPLPVVWPRPHFTAGDLPTKICFVCFAEQPFAELEFDRARFGLPSVELSPGCELREYLRADARDWLEGWWRGSFGVIAERDLGADLQQLTRSDRCMAVRLELGDRADLAPLQVGWGVVRWLCVRGASVVLDVHTLRFRTRAAVEALEFAGSDLERDVKLVLENQPTRDGLHLLHTRGLCKVARPELVCFIRPEDATSMGRLLVQIARTLMEGALASQIRLRAAAGVELVAAAEVDRQLVESLGIEAGIELVRSDGAPLAGIGRLVAPA